jgi:hypothetical protein
VLFVFKAGRRPLAAVASVELWVRQLGSKRVK